MKNIIRAVIHPHKHKRTLPSSNIAQFVADQLGVELWDCKEKLVYKHIDELYYVFGMHAFSDFREEMGALTKKTVKYIHIENDFTGGNLTQTERPMREKGSPAIFLTTIPSRIKNNRGVYINWNQLTWDPIPVQKLAPLRQRISGMMYYGAFRKDRGEPFARYMSHDLFPLHVYTGRNGKRDFAELNQRIHVNDRADDLINTITKHQFSLYIEDAYSTKRYTSPANRFYECLSAGTPILFDHLAIPTMLEAGFDVSDFAVSSPKDIVALLPHLDSIYKAQLTWRKTNFKECLKQDFKEAVSYIGSL